MSSLNQIEHVCEHIEGLEQMIKWEYERTNPDENVIAELEKEVEKMTRILRVKEARR